MEKLQLEKTVMEAVEKAKSDLAAALEHDGPTSSSCIFLSLWNLLSSYAFSSHNFLSSHSILVIVRSPNLKQR